MGRAYIYDSTMNRLPTSGQIGVNDLAADSRSCHGANTTSRAQRLACFDFVLGSQYLMGSIPAFRANLLYDPADADAAALRATLRKLTAFYKAAP